MSRPMRRGEHVVGHRGSLRHGARSFGRTVLGGTERPASRGSAPTAGAQARRCNRIATVESGQPPGTRADLPGGRLVAVGAVDEVLGVVVARSPRMVPGCGVVEVGGAHQRADQRERVVLGALDHHGEHRRAGDEVDQLAVERLALVLGVVLLGVASSTLRSSAATSVRPLRSRRATISPTRPRSTASGLQMTKVRSMARGGLARPSTARSAAAGGRRTT